MVEFRYDPLPLAREQFEAGELPICQVDVRQLSQVFGEEVAENARITAQEIRRRGGINPEAVKTVFPQGLEGPLDEQALFRVMTNLAIWWSINDSKSTIL